MTVCYYCANDPTESAPVVKDDDDRLAHVQRPCAEAIGEEGQRVYPDDDPDTPIPVCGHVECQEDWDPCPEPPDGYEQCIVCLAARRTDRMGYAASVPTRQGKGWLGTADMIVASSKPSMTAADGAPYYVCRFGGCAGRADQRLGQVKQVAARVIDRDDDTRQEDADDEKADMLPDDGPGLPVEDVAALWKVSVRTARTILARLLEVEMVRAEEVPTKARGKPRKHYWRDRA